MKNTTTRVLLSQERFQITVERLCRQLIENYDTFEDTCLIGIQTKGVFLANRMEKRIREILNVPQIEYGKLDITFYRDDFRRREGHLQPNKTKIDFLVEDQKVVFIDDVLYTGRSVRAAMDAILSFGRPSKMELLTLIDRRFSRDLPIQPDYKGRQVDSIESQRVEVLWQEINGRDAVLLTEPNS